MNATSTNVLMVSEALIDMGIPLDAEIAESPVVSAHPPTCPMAAHRPGRGCAA